jgi:transposase InsO family protein
VAAPGSPPALALLQGRQFTDKGFRRWCLRRRIRQRFGAVQKYGSISVVERLIRTMKSEALRRILIPFDQASFKREVGLFVVSSWRPRYHGICWLKCPKCRGSESLDDFSMRRFTRLAK